MPDHATIPNSTDIDLRYCKCGRCGGKMVMAYSMVDGRYYGVCENCEICTPAVEDPEIAQ